MKKWFSGSFLMAHWNPMPKIIFLQHVSCDNVTQILLYALDHNEPTNSFQKTIFSSFLMQNSLSKFGNKSVGNPRVKLIHIANHEHGGMTAQLMG